jgi:uncharacterized protein (TIGR02145 family)
VPTYAEWTTLTNFLGGASVAGGKMKSTSTFYWISPNTSATNESGFSGLPAGTRVGNGVYALISDSGFWWSSTEANTTDAWNHNLLYNYGNENRYFLTKQNGFSVRCVRD